MKPSVGSIVHFYDRSLEHTAIGGMGPYPAIILGVNSDGTVDLQAFQGRGIPSTFDAQSNVPETTDSWGARAWWEWPPRESKS